ncbi:MAG: DUF697 domain-containing protein [Cyanobacteria bacterium J06627_28]
MQLKRPILVGGLGLSASLGLLNIVGHSPLGHALGDGSTLMGAMALGAGFWLFKKSTPASLKVEPLLAVGPVDKSAVDSAIEQVEATLAQLITELPESERGNKALPVWSQIEEKRQAIAQLLTNLDRTQLSFSVIGNKATGKTTLISQLSGHFQNKSITNFVEVNGEENLPSTDADLVLFVTAGDLTQSELKRIHALLKAGYRTQIVFNKQDQLAPADRQSVLQQIQTRVEDLEIGVSAIAANPNPIKVRRHKEDGTIQESTEQPESQLSSITDRLTYLVENETQQLVLTTTLRQAKALQQSTQQLLNAQRKQRALPIVEQMQWIAAGSAFASPLPSLDLLASTAINAQLIVDLGAVYGQKFSLEQAKQAAGTLAELLVKLGLVEVSTQALGAMLKVHVATYVAGGAMQGVSAAYLTRMVGLSLIDFFEERSLLPKKQQKKQQKFAFAEMGDRLQAIFKATKQTAGLQSFVQQALSHLPSVETADPEKAAIAQ